MYSPSTPVQSPTATAEQNLGNATCGLPGLGKDRLLIRWSVPHASARNRDG